MNIEIDKYLIKPAKNTNTKWDVYKKGVSRDVRGKELAYGITLPRAVEIIVAHQLRNIEGTVTLKEYFNEHSQAINEIAETLKNKIK